MSETKLSPVELLAGLPVSANLWILIVHNVLLFLNQVDGILPDDYR